MSHICVYKTPPLKTEIANVWIWKTYQYEGWKAVVDNAVRHVQLFISTRAASLHPLSCWHFYFIPACLDSSFIYRCVMVTRQGNKSSRGWNCAVQEVFLSLADRIPTSRKLDQLDGRNEEVYVAQYDISHFADRLCKLFYGKKRCTAVYVNVIKEK